MNRLKIPSLIIAILVSAGTITSAHVAPPIPRTPEPPATTEPIGNIISDLTKAIEKDPDSTDLGLLHHLARAHAFAYSQKLLDTDKVSKRLGQQGIWFENNRSLIPFSETKETEEENRQMVAEAHLTLALTTYKTIVKALPNCGEDIKTGLAWCLKESGQTDAAIATFREAVEATWKKEYRRLAHGDKSNFVEIAEQLMPLLDGDELAELKIRHKKISTEPRPVRCPGPIPVPPRVPMPKPDIVAPGPNIPVPNAEFLK